MDKIVVNFPELTYSAQCSVCRLAKTYPGIFKICHDLRFHKNTGYQTIAKAINPLLDRVGEKNLSWPSISRHFKNHVNFQIESFRESIRVVNLDTVLTTDRMDFDESQMRRLYYSGNAVGHEDIDYQEMWRLFTKVIQRVESVNADPNAFRTEAGKINFNALGSWSSLVTNAKGILTDIHKMRNSDKFLALILQKHTLAYGAAIAQPIAEIMRQILVELKRLNADPETTEKVENLLAGGMAELFGRVALTTLKQTRKENKIPNAA